MADHEEAYQAKGLVFGDLHMEELAFKSRYWDCAGVQEAVEDLVEIEDMVDDEEVVYSAKDIEARGTTSH